MGDTKQLKEQIAGLKKALNATIVAHNYQRPEVQEVADFVGDSLELARRCVTTDTRTIVFCGVYFMAEMAAILNPGRTVLLAAAGAACPMADMVSTAQLQEWQQRYPRVPVVSYVNTSAATKAMSYICCTSANGAEVVASVPGDEVLFVPDRNLGHYIATRSRKKIILFPGYCYVHDRITPQQVREVKQRYPGAPVIVHPECTPEVTALADTVLSTSQMLRYVASSPQQSFIIGTEEGLLHRMRRENPGKFFYTISPGPVCTDMKKTTLETLARTMSLCENAVSVPEEVAVKARQALQRMLAVGTKDGEVSR
jgi:quinolinate synthase